jgi:hypothetical protein
MKKMSKLIFLCFLFIFVSCGKRLLAPPIENNMSFPGDMVALNSNSFLLLNTSANGDYSDGSIQQYSVNSLGFHSLQTILSVPSHGTELAVSNDSKLVALSFDSSYSDTQVHFYNYSNVSNPTSLSHITLNLPAAGGKQAIKRLGFFQRTGGDTSYYFYGAILSYPNDDGSNGNIPPRVFVAKIASDFSSSQILFILSYGLNDPNSLAPLLTSLNSQIPSNEVQYTFGYNAPTYDASHDLFIAFPSGTTGGYNSGINSYPALPDPLTYFSGNSNSTTCNGVACKIQPDYRAVSLAAVDMSSIYSGNPINNSTYFVPLGWNQNGMPYASLSNGINIINQSKTSNVDLNSYTFQTGYWSSYWANTKNNGAGGLACFNSGVVTTSSNQFTVSGDNTLFVVKIGSNGGNDMSNSGGKAGNGNEVFAITGLDILKNNITTIKAARGAIVSSGESDFSTISKYQLIDPYNPTVKGTWFTGQGASAANAGPLIPFMYSRTSNVDNFDTTPTGISRISVLNFGANQCQPYWARNTVLSGSLGRDTAWLTSNSVSLSAGANSTYPYLTSDPTKPSVFSFSTATGAQTCTDVFASANSPRVFCVNFLTSDISKYTVTQTIPVFTSY